MRAILGITFLIAGGVYASEFTGLTVGFSMQHPQLVISVSKASVQLSQMFTEANCKDKTNSKAEPGYCEVLALLSADFKKSEELKIKLPKIYDGVAAYAAVGAGDLVFQDFIRDVQSHDPELSENDVVNQTSEVLSVITAPADVQKAK